MNEFIDVFVFLIYIFNLITICLLSFYVVINFKNIRDNLKNLTSRINRLENKVLSQLPPEYQQEQEQEQEQELTKT